jgi:uncharacterized protein (TIGR01777 family)
VKVLISGASGLIGTELNLQLKAQGHQVVRLVRRPARSEEELFWNPGKAELDPASLSDVDAVINLAGATTGKIPWTKNYEKELISSRLDSTKTLVDAINACPNPPKVFVSGSASGIYGDQGDAWLDESSPKGEGFLADLAYQWEEAA